MTIRLTFCDQDSARAVFQTSGGSSPAPGALATDPLAIDKRPRTGRHDHVSLQQVDGSPFVYWSGRGADGYHHVLSPFMEIVETT